MSYLDNNGFFEKFKKMIRKPKTFEEKVREIIDAKKLRRLANWLDVMDTAEPGISNEIQTDLRKLADVLDPTRGVGR